MWKAVGRACATNALEASSALAKWQLERIVKHVKKRFRRGEVWSYTTPNGPRAIRSPEDVNLYDLDHFVIKPATEHHQCSMVGLMASGEQPPHRRPAKQHSVCKQATHRDCFGAQVQPTGADVDRHRARVAKSRALESQPQD